MAGYVVYWLIGANLIGGTQAQPQAVAQTAEGE